MPNTSDLKTTSNSSSTEETEMLVVSVHGSIRMNCVKCIVAFMVEKKDVYWVLILVFVNRLPSDQDFVTALLIQL